MPQAESRFAIAAPWAESAESVARSLSVDVARGLSTSAVAERLAEVGRNELEATPRRGLLAAFVAQFKNLMIGLLAVAAAVSAALGDWQDSVLIGLIAVANAVIGCLQERRAEDALDALRRLALPMARAWRDGALVEIPAGEIVPGDVVELSLGVAVPADARLIGSVELQTNEASLTGESLPIEKTIEALPSDCGLADRTNMVFAGTTVAAGRGRALVAATGMQTELGRVARLLEQAEPEPTPLEQRLERLSRQLALGVVAVCGLVFLLGFLRRESIAWNEMLLLSVSLAVAAIPEGLPAIITVSLALGSQRMSRRKAIIRQLAAVETLGSVDVICSDKTGTLTRNQMRVASVQPVDGGADARLRLLEIAALCNDAETDAQGNLTGSATERALLEAAAAELDITELRRRWPRRGEAAFTSARKRMSTWHDDPSGRTWLFVKGAAEMVLEHAAQQFVGSASKPLDAESRAAIVRQVAELASRGERVLGLAYRELEPSALAAGPPAEQDLVFVGLIGIADPLRPEAAEAIARCRSAGIRPVMITGDHLETARAIATSAGILLGDARAISGAELDRLSDDELRQAARETSVYARVAPEHKLRIVRAHQAEGSVVAMTGDGVNDAPALRQAEIGVAMGLTGSDVTKQAANMVLADDNIATLVAAVEEGRIVYDNIRKFVRYLLTANSSEVLVLAFAMLAGLPPPLLPVHLLWINLVTDGLPALALGYEPAERGLMRRPPRRRQESLFAGGMAAEIIVLGLGMAIACLGVYRWLLPAGGEAYARSAVFLTLALFQLFYVMALRSSTEPLWRIGLWSNYRLTVAVGVGCLLQVACLYAPPIARVFHVVPLQPLHFGVCVAVAATAYVVMEARKLLGLRRPDNNNLSGPSAGSH